MGSFPGLQTAGLGLAVVCVLGAPPRLAAQASDARRGLALADYYRLETAATPAVSPDGRRVAFVRTYVVEVEDRRNSEIWLAPADGAAPAVRLTHPAFSSTAPRWSPDGRLLAFTSRRKVPGGGEESGTWFLRMDEPGGEAFAIEGVGGPAVFSPDGRWIAFTKKATSPKAPPAAASEFDRLVRERFKGRVVDWLGYRADGRGYLPDPRDPAASPPEELFVVPREGGTPRQLTRLGVDVRQPAWRPDSRALVMVADSHQRDEYSYERADLWLVTLDGETKRLTADDGFDHEAPAFSPDGRQVAFRRTLGLSAVIVARQDHGAAEDVYRMPVEGGPPTNLTADCDLIPGDPAWSSDGRFVCFGAGLGGQAHLFRVPAGGGGVEQVTRGARRLSGFSVSADSTRVAYTVTDPTHPAEVFAARGDGSEERRVSGVNDALLREVDLAPAERLLFKSRDGTPVEGWLILPRGRDAAQAPLILTIHGGPHGAYGEEFSFPWQLWAARGYGVLYTNPRGSTGYGERFLWATWGGGWGLKDSEDVLAGVEAALAKHPFDPKRLGVSGYSYGGFLVNWLIGHTTRFRAAISGAGVSNWVSDYGTADIPRTKESEFYGPPWEARGRELLLRQSPIFNAGSVATPTLFLHGEADVRVPIEQAEQMYVALRKRKVPARLVRYPDMAHGNWTPWNMVHRHDQELRWWDEHLGGKPSP